MKDYYEDGLNFLPSVEDFSRYDVNTLLHTVHNFKKDYLNVLHRLPKTKLGDITQCWFNILEYVNKNSSKMIENTVEKIREGIDILNKDKELTLEDLETLQNIIRYNNNKILELSKVMTDLILNRFSENNNKELSSDRNDIKDSIINDLNNYIDSLKSIFSNNEELSNNESAPKDSNVDVAVKDFPKILDNYVTAREAKQILHINATTLKTWKDKDKIKYRKLSDKKYLYDIDSILKTNTIDKYNVIYARVSNIKLIKDLNSQIELIKSYCLSKGIKVDKIYQDIASGMNENRKNFNLLIDDVIDRKINKVYISFKDRLTRFGFEYFKLLFAKYDTLIIVLDNLEESNKTFQEELTEDLINIIHHFSKKLYSNRIKKFKEIEQILENSLDK